MSVSSNGGGRRLASWALADQALISGCNFLTVLLVARALPQAAFGLYTVAYTSLYISNTLQSALIAEPHAVLSASRRGRAYIDYTTSTGAMQLAMVVLLAAIALVTALVVGSGTDLGPLILALGLAAIGWQLQEFCRRVMYVEDRIGSAFFNDLISYGGQLIIVAGLAWAGLLTPVSAILAIGGTSILAAAIGALQIRPSLGGRTIRAEIMGNLRFGKWLAASELTGIVSLRLWAYLIAAIAGAAAAGSFGAASLIFGPINVIVFAVTTVMPIPLARARVEGGDESLRAMIRRFHYLTVPLVMAICLAVAFFAEPITELLYQGKYPGLGTLIAALAVYNIVRYLLALVTVALAASERTRAIFLTSLVGAGVTLASGTWLVAGSGAEGAALGMVLATSGTLVAAWVAFLRTPRTTDPLYAPATRRNDGIRRRLAHAHPGHRRRNPGPSAS